MEQLPGDRRAAALPRGLDRRAARVPARRAEAAARAQRSRPEWTAGPERVTARRPLRVLLRGSPPRRGRATLLPARVLKRPFRPLPDRGRQVAVRAVAERLVAGR